MSRTCFDHYQRDGPDTHDRHDGNNEQPCEVLIKEEGQIGLSLGAHDVFGHL